ncbi:hypothetical protein NDU88_002633 [Pleurodeles waltl]|uniref:Uncharacterized protein n=1 Tax=Pleurodeles waltl TaxID=8319 RepID=A0AAV7TMB9_PLEWA|nr:hypothetical protein NDU88_002633 [Pleurodeles waltl]
MTAEGGNNLERPGGLRPLQSAALKMGSEGTRKAQDGGPQMEVLSVTQWILVTPILLPETRTADQQLNGAGSWAPATPDKESAPAAQHGAGQRTTCRLS